MEQFCSAAILAGGKSQRMGFDKQLFHIEKDQMFELFWFALSWRFEDILIVTEKTELYSDQKIRAVSDIIPDLGPLSGIHAALSQSKSEYVYVVACDMPMIDLKYIEYLKKRLELSPADACVTRIGNRVEPFHAFFSKRALPVIEEDLLAGKSSIHYLLDKINTL
jgi:molybdopterin-guanine dinucleotide biosynthesis protein A